MCYNLALKHNISHCRLPINKFLSMKTRQVLTVNHVYQIICSYIECGDWKQAFISTLPSRKGAETISDSEDNQESPKEDENENATKKAKLEHETLPEEKTKNSTIQF